MFRMIVRAVSLFFFLSYKFGPLYLFHGLNELKTSNNIKHNRSWTELLAINNVSIYILILAVGLIFHNKVYKNKCWSEPYS